jgi:hypothetical protein
LVDGDPKIFFSGIHTPVFDLDCLFELLLACSLKALAIIFSNAILFEAGSKSWHTDTDSLESDYLAVDDKSFTIKVLHADIFYCF